MAEWAFATLLLAAFAVLLARRGYTHLVVPRLPWVMMGAGVAAAWMLESLPFSAYRAQPSLLTAIAGAVGLMTGRLAARAMRGWGRGLEKDIVSGHATADARMVHPILAGGLVVLGAPLLYMLVALRHESLEIMNTPRDPATSVVLGAEDRRIPGDASLSQGVLLVHGYLGSPADFGELPDRLRARRLTVRVLRLPGHGTGPSVLDDVTTTEYADAVETARDELSHSCRRVSIVGFSFGGALAIRSAASHDYDRVVLVNPWLGRTWTPAWLPFETDAVMSLASKTTSRIFRPAGMTRCNDPAGLPRLRFYSTVRTRAAAAARDYAAASSAPEFTAKLRAPLLVLASEHDRTAKPEATISWFESVPLALRAEPAGDGATQGTKTMLRFPRSDHLLLHDYDREAAIDAIVRFVAD